MIDTNNNKQESHKQHHHGNVPLLVASVTFPRSVDSLASRWHSYVSEWHYQMGSFVVCSVVVLLGVAGREDLMCGTVPFYVSFMHGFLSVKLKCIFDMVLLCFSECLLIYDTFYFFIFYFYGDVVVNRSTVDSMVM